MSHSNISAAAASEKAQTSVLLVLLMLGNLITGFVQKNEEPTCISRPSFYLTVALHEHDQQYPVNLGQNHYSATEEITSYQQD